MTKLTMGYLLAVARLQIWGVWVLGLVARLGEDWVALVVI